MYVDNGLEGVIKIGYILPITNSQYYDYQRRIMDEKKNHYFINKPFKVILENRHENIKNKINPKQLNQVYTRSKNFQMEKTTYDLSGKGNLFNDIV